MKWYPSDIAWKWCVGEIESILMQTEWQPVIFFVQKQSAAPSHQGHMQLHLPVRSKNPRWTRYGLAAGDGWEEEGEQQVKTRQMPTFISPCCCILSFLQACRSPGMHDSQVLLWQNISNSGTNALSFKFTANVSAKIDQTSFCKIKPFKRESTSAL